ncbi:MAG TPA: hypothetical protein VI037_03915 [Nitrososphaera sp.]
MYEIVQFNPAAPEGGSGRGKGIVTAVFQTNSNNMLAPLNGMIAAGIDDMKSSGASYVTLWRWENGISNNNNSTGIAAPSTIQGEYLINPPQQRQMLLLLLTPIQRHMLNKDKKNDKQLQ